MYGKMIKIWHLLRGIMLWTIWTECNDKVLNREQWHETKVKHHIWDEFIIYVMAAWEQVLKQIETCEFSKAAMLQGFNKTWGTRDFLYKTHNLHISWN